jgi:hypothetical protein
VATNQRTQSRVRRLLRRAIRQTGTARRPVAVDE